MNKKTILAISVILLANVNSMLQTADARKEPFKNIRNSNFSHERRIEYIERNQRELMRVQKLMRAMEDPELIDLDLLPDGVPAIKPPRIDVPRLDIERIIELEKDNAPTERIQVLPQGNVETVRVREDLEVLSA